MSRKPLGTLIVMAKAPRLGLGKSRLARETGRCEALRINRWLQRATLRIAVDTRWRTVLAVSPDRALRHRVPGIWPQAIERTPQGMGDLGVRMRRVLRRQPGRVAIIGADCPGLRKADIVRAFQSLASHVAAIGPSTDGGFWIAAARRSAILEHAFTAVRWSSPATAEEVRARLPLHAQLRVLQDVDTLDDLRAVRVVSQRAPVATPEAIFVSSA